jgi:hypothetical protein
VTDLLLIVGLATAAVLGTAGVLLSRRS